MFGGRVGSWYRVAKSAGSRVEIRGLAWLAAPLALIIGIPVADHFLPPYIHLAHALVVASAFTAALAGPRLTAVISSLAVASLVAAGADRHTLTTESVLVEITALVAVSALLVLFSHLRVRRALELVRVRRVSDAAQRAVLRPLPARAGPVSIAAEYRAVEDDARIGGDLYAVARTANSTRLIIADVSGKGLASINDTATVLGAFRAAAHRGLPLPELVAYLEDAVSWGSAECPESERDVGQCFVTAAVADIPDDEPIVRLISCGHPPPLLLRPDTATVTSLAVPQPAPPLGLGSLFDTSYSPTTFPFARGDRLVLYTDGVTEARDRNGVFYPLAERVAGWTGEPPEALVEKITADLLTYASGPLKDDMALIVAQRQHPPSP